jgi:hypothetical protein
MCKRAVFVFALIICCMHFYGQNKKHAVRVGFNYGFGNEIKNSNFSHSNSSYKFQFNYTVKEGRNFNYELLLQPELNLATHQLLNPYFIGENEPDYIEKRLKYGNKRSIREYIFNIGFIVRKPISDSFSVYLLGSVGPMIMDKETERLPSGLAFSDVIALGASLKCKKIQFDLRPSFRHVSNAGLQSPNSGFNTMNIEFGFTLGL